MKIALVQTSLIWEDPTENRSHLAQKITGFMEEVDLIVLPEMFSSGFTMNPKVVAETMQRRNDFVASTSGESQKLRYHRKFGN